MMGFILTISMTPDLDCYPPTAGAQMQNTLSCVVFVLLTEESCFYFNESIAFTLRKKNNIYLQFKLQFKFEARYEFRETSEEYYSSPCWEVASHLNWTFRKFSHPTSVWKMFVFTLQGPYVISAHAKKAFYISQRQQIGTGCVCMFLNVCVCVCVPVWQKPWSHSHTCWFQWVWAIQPGRVTSPQIEARLGMTAFMRRFSDYLPDDATDSSHACVCGGGVSKQNTFIIHQTLATCEAAPIRPLCSSCLLM